MERVSFKVAKALKEAGYPQLGVELWYTIEGKYIDGCSRERYAICPTYLEVWLWLWKEKEMRIEIKDNYYYTLAKVNNKRFHEDSPEEAIIEAIEYLVDNDLIK